MTSSDDGARERSRAVWDDMAAGWEAEREWLWELSRPVSEWLVEHLDLRPGHTILDVAAGLGETGFLAARRVGAGGRVLITDFAPAMVEAARRRARETGVTNADFMELNAERMSLASGSVDGVLCRWGYMLMHDPAAAFSETHRVLRPGGGLAFAVFGAPERNPWASLVGRILIDEGHAPPPSPGIFALADPERLRGLVTGAGLAPPEVAEMALTWRFRDPDAYWWFLTRMAGAIASVLRGLTPEARGRIRARIDEAAQPFRSGDGYAFPALCLNVATRKPD